jgi:hypothetical protein
VAGLRDLGLAILGTSKSSDGSLRKLIILPLALGLMQGCKVSPSKDNKIQHSSNLVFEKITSTDEEEVVTTGKIKEIILDGKEEKYTKHLYFFITDSGKRLKIYNTDLKNYKIPINTNLKVKYFHKPDGSIVLKHLFNIERNLSKSLSAQVESTIEDEKEIKDIGIYYLNYSDSNRWDQNTIDQKEKIIKDYLNKISNGKWIVSVTSYKVSVGYTAKECHGETRIADCAKEFRNKAFPEFIRVNDLQHNYHSLIIGFYNARYCGKAAVGGNVNTNWCTGVDTILHELGHNFGLGHAALPGIEYGDDSTIMGAGKVIPEINSVELHYLDLFNPETVYYLDSTEQVFLAPLELESFEITPGLNQIVKFARLYVSTRASASKYVVSEKYRKKVFVHKDSGGGSTLMATLSEGESFTERGSKVHFISMKNGIAKVNFYKSEADPQPEDKNFPEEDNSIKIYASKTNTYGTPEDHYSLSTDTIYWRVLGAGANAYACAEYKAEDGSRGNSGKCDDFSNFKPASSLKKWDWDERLKVWTLTQKLPENNTFIPGVYRFVWQNMDTRKESDLTINVSP